jgi:nucleotide-binding universal stress UspA family protein
MRLLVAIDGSQPALNALRFALGLCGQLKIPGGIGLVHVQDDTALRNATHVLGRKPVDEYLREEADRELADALELVRRDGAPFEILRRTGRPEHEICAAAAEGGFDMLVMGSKGRTGLADLVMGSVAQRVAAAAPLPVVLVK